MHLLRDMFLVIVGRGADFGSGSGCGYVCGRNERFPAIYTRVVVSNMTGTNKVSSAW